MHCKKLLFIIVIIFLQGCTLPIKSSSINDFKGIWESVGLYGYARLELLSEKDILLGLVFEEEDVKIFKANSFILNPEGFSVNLIEITGNDKAMNINGKLLLNKLALYKVGKEDEIMWFVKESVVVGAKNAAVDTILKQRLLQ